MQYSFTCILIYILKTQIIFNIHISIIIVGNFILKLLILIFYTFLYILYILMTCACLHFPLFPLYTTILSFVNVQVKNLSTV